MSAEDNFETLVAMMDRLRAPDGCPWDREQTYSTLRGYLLEECYEVVDAIDRGDRGGLLEELGDLLFQVVFLSRLAKEEGCFEAGDVVRGIARKMIRRHPHVFGDDRVETADAVLKRWEEIKRSEKSVASSSVLEGLPRALPSLLKAHRLATKAARVGFDWPHARGVIEKIDEESRELREAVESGDTARAAEELGDLLFTLAALGRRLGLDPEAALEAANAKFVRRFGAMERELARRGLSPEEAGLDLMDRIWNELKREERHEGT